MYLAGVRVPDEDVLTLIRLLYEAGFDYAAQALVVALEAGEGIVGLSMDDREAILRSLHDPPIGLTHLRDVLLTEHGWRMRVGLEPGDVDWDS